MPSMTAPVEPTELQIAYLPSRLHRTRCRVPVGVSLVILISYATYAILFPFVLVFVIPNYTIVVWHGWSLIPIIFYFFGILMVLFFSVFASDCRLTSIRWICPRVVSGSRCVLLSLFFYCLACYFLSCYMYIIAHGRDTVGHSLSIFSKKTKLFLIEIQSH